MDQTTLRQSSSKPVSAPKAERVASILVVDDTESSRYFVRRQLTQAGYEVREACTVSEGLAAIARRTPDLVILDIKLPDGSGLELCKQLRRTSAGALLPIIQISATFIQGEDYARGLDSGADSYLAQPIDPPVLLATVRSLLRARQAEAATARLAAIVDNADEPIISKDLNGIITSWNSAAERVFGYPAEEAVGKPMTLIMPSELHPTEQAFLERLSAGERIEQIETQRVTRDGRRIDALVTISPIRDEVGRIIGASSIIRDITRRKEAEEAVRVSEARLKTIIENLHEGLIVASIDGQALHWNRKALEMHGYTSQETAPTVWSEAVALYDVFTLEDLPVPVQQWPLPRLLREGRLDNYELKVRHRRHNWERILNFGGVVLAGSKKTEPLGLLTIRDVSEQRRAAEALRLSEQRYRCFVKASSQVVWTMGPTGEATTSMPDWNAYTGQTEEQARGFGWLEAIWLEDRERVVKAWRGAAASQQSYEVQYRLRRRDGEWRDMLARGVPILESTGDILEWIGTCTDITEQKRAQEALRLAEERLDRIISSAMDGVISINAEQRIVLFNPAAEQLFGMSASQAIGRHINDLIPERFRKMHVKEVRRFANTGSTSRRMGRLGTLSGLRANGQEFPIEASISHAEVGGEKLYTVILRDISERQEAEARLQRQANLIDLTPTAMLVQDPYGAIRFWNKGAEELYGWKREEALGRVSHQLLKTEFPEPMEVITAGLKQTGAWSGELRQRKSTGDLVIVQSWWLAKRGPEGQVLEILESNIDITERKQLQERLEQLVEERTARLRDTVGDLEHFSYTITHDMRAPLRAMQAFGQMLEMEYDNRLDETGRDYLRRIIQSSQRMDHLITDALSYAKIMREEMSLAPVDVEALLKGMVNSYPEFQPPRAHVEIQEGIPWVIGNNAGLTQCFSNLLGNAVKFVEPGTHPRVRVWAEPRDRKVRLWVEDNGIGISSEDHQRIFTMFQRLSKKHEGTGIGLALVQKVVGRMRGRVGVESESGRGSRFWVEFAAAPQSKLSGGGVK